MKLETEHKPLASFSFSSLTDIVLLLLIFFLLTSQFVVNNGVAIKLPETENAKETPPSRLVVAIDAAGKFYFKGKTVSLEKLSALFSEAKRNEKTSLIIQADKETALEHVVRVIDVARGAGITKFTVQTEKVGKK